MTAVIAKAADAGYNFVILLSGLTDALRVQTQERFMGDLGLDSVHWYAHTHMPTDNSNGDFGRLRAFPRTANDQTQIMVVKKNAHVLRSVIRAARRTAPAITKGWNVLVVDDECDQASVNSARYSDQMTRINQLVRELIHKFDRVSYIGYSATPFANILINPYAKHDGTDEVLDDLYPKDFIYCLPQPAGYFGAERLFGRSLIDGDAQEEEFDGLDIIREIPPDEAGSYRPATRADREEFELEIGGSLEEALEYHLLAASCRLHRDGPQAVCGMLVHTTSYTAPHDTIAAAVEGWLTRTCEQLEQAPDELIGRFEKLWDDEGVALPSEQWGLDRPPVKQLLPRLRELLNQGSDLAMKVIVENGQSQTRLNFAKFPRYIVVGGAILSRGLTLEGLTTSFFTRSSSQYDTLMQMGRWFGYRGGYEDLPRAWMPSRLHEAFRDLATVEAEIRAEIAANNRRGTTPMDVAIRIRQLPGMAITAANRMRHAQAVDISMSGQHRQTFKFYAHDPDWLKRNYEAGLDLIDRAGIASGHGGRMNPRTGSGGIYRDVPLEEIRQFLATYQVHPQHDELQGSLLMDYIKREQESSPGALSHWTVLVLGPSKGRGTPADELLPGLCKTTRSRIKSLTSDGAADIKSLMSRADILADSEEGPDSPRSSWEDVKSKRRRLLQEAGIPDSPQLFLYLIDAESKPRSKNRLALEAAGDVLAMAISFPPSTRSDGQAYVQVRLRQPDATELEVEEPDLPELNDEDIENE
jgi:hypothetical protein